MKKVLIVEDEEDILNLVRIILEISGYEVITAQDGYQGLELIKKKPDLIILDLMMPGMTGWEYLDKIRSEGYSNIPVIVLTANAQISTIETAINKKVDDCIVKPFDRDDLLLKVKAILSNQN
ncbi:response regulator receiver protein [Methanococcus vannielii SB]|uniref:Response regulator receiver protein n=1 Tax=Methanococcus vannielii (strain ATCC 35089 / DSM 1224 / JCM 13029 / OCM 148 / SB) TaxID=406327 RepID=A6UPU8_METVS|nr:response regulator transcription factor [Methanococcus vannielii]ABR54520.1 response regulator receiver protein [Methanococcus vannielii SB]